MASLWTMAIHWPCVLVVIFCALAKDYALGKGENNGCTAVKHAYGSKGYNHYDVPSKMIPGEHLRVCPQGFTCCTQEMEYKLSQQSQREFDKLMGDKISLLRNVFISRTAKFDAFFTELLDNAKRDLHDMFVRTYGLLYQQNAHVFKDLFENLRRYYKGSDINLLDALDGFFVTLLQKMFELLNAQYVFDEEYLQCVTDHMDKLKPFGDVPQKLSVQVKRSFIAARTFVQGLAIGRDVILELSKLEPSQSCNNAVVKLLYCPYCRGLPNVKPCNNYCMNVMRGCLAYHAELNQEWNNFIDALMKVAERLEGPFNIEQVVDPIDVKISDAIMNFQENSDTVTNKVFQGCGKPPPDDRKKRSAASYDDYSHSWKGKDKQQHVRPTTAAGTSLDRLVRDIKEKVQVTKDFWRGLPDSICNDVASPVYETANCWNGLGKAGYQPDVMGDGIINQINNPEVEVDVRKPNTAVNLQILQLKLITNKLRNAYNGLDVDWIDTADVMHASGSGSGSGSGDGPYVHNDEISFTHSTHRPVVVETRRPLETQYDDFSGASTIHHRLSLLLVLLLLTSIFIHKRC